MVDIEFSHCICLLYLAFLGLQKTQAINLLSVNCEYSMNYSSVRYTLFMFMSDVFTT